MPRAASSRLSSSDQPTPTTDRASGVSSAEPAAHGVGSAVAAGAVDSAQSTADDLVTRESDSESVSAMLIGEVAERTGLTQRTLRYYEEIGLLSPAPRLEGGFRLYSEADVHRLHRILDLKRLLGFSLLEIKDMVQAEEERRGRRHAFHQEPDPIARREHVARALDLARYQISKLDEHLAALTELRRKTEARIRRYETELAGLPLLASEPALATTEQVGERSDDPRRAEGFTGDENSTRDGSASSAEGGAFVQSDPSEALSRQGPSS